MMKMRLFLIFGLLAVLCLSYTTAEDAHAEPESEPEGEPHNHDEDSKQKSVGGKLKGEGGKNSGNMIKNWQVPAMVLFVAVAKIIL